MSNFDEAYAAVYEEHRLKIETVLDPTLGYLADKILKSFVYDVVQETRRSTRAAAIPLPATPQSQYEQASSW